MAGRGEQGRGGWYARTGKRGLDLVAGGAMLVILSPLMVVIALLVWVNMGRPVFFRQARPGKDGAPFVMFKFRTMRDAVDGAGRPLADAERLTRLGRTLRRTSLDEMPELLNVVRGEMSLVGPRPLLMKYLPLYTPEQMRRHAVRPGISGWAQVNGRNALSWEEKFALDTWYVDHLSLGLDLRIAWMTVRAILSASGVSQAGHATAEEFRGTPHG